MSLLSSQQFKILQLPNWQHHSKKEQKPTKKPKALRRARHRLKSLIKKLRRN